jgi:hypothetical protein
VKLGPTGAELWSRTLAFGDDEVVINAIAVDASGNVYLAGELSGDSATGTSDAFVRKYSTSGTELWTRQVTTNSDRGDPEDSREYASALAVDASGNVFIGGSAGKSFGGGPSTGSGPFFLRMLDASGGVLVDAAVRTLVDRRVRGRAQRAGGERRRRHASTRQERSAVRCPPTLTLAAPMRSCRPTPRTARARGHTNSARTTTTSATGVALGANGDVYVVGFTKAALPPATHLGGTDAFVRRLAPASGAAIWTRSYGTSDDDTGMGVHISALGALLLGGPPRGRSRRRRALATRTRS